MSNNINIKQVLQNRSFSQICIALLYIVHIMPVLLFVMAINARIGLGFLNSNLTLIVSVLLVLLSLSVFYKRLRWWDYLVVVGIGIFCLWSPNLYPQTTFAVGLFAPYFVFSCLPLYLVGATVQLQDEEDLFVVIGRLGVIVNSFFCVLALAGLTEQAGDLSEERQGAAYNLLPMVILTSWNEMRRHNIIDMSLTLIGLFLIFSMGARGPILSIALFLFGYIFLFRTYKRGTAVRIIMIVMMG